MPLVCPRASRVEDVERYCAYLLHRSTRVDDWEDALTWAIERCWELSPRFDPESRSLFVHFARAEDRLGDYLRWRGRVAGLAGSRGPPTCAPVRPSCRSRTHPELAATPDDDGPSLAELLGLLAEDLIVKDDACARDCDS